MLEEEVEEWAKLSEDNKRTVEISKQKCKASIIVGFKDNPNLMWEFYKEEYGHEMTLSEKLEFSDEEPEEDNSK